MKKYKILSLFLAVVFVFSCFSVTAYAEPQTGLTNTGIDQDYADIDAECFMVTVHYVYADGSKAAEDTVTQFWNGETGTVPSPSIDGFTPDKVTVEATEDGEFTVTYIKNGSGDSGEGGNGGQQGGSVAPAKPIVLKAPVLKKVKKGKKRFTATWTKLSGVKRYEIQYSRNKKFKKGKKYGTKIKKVSASKAKVTIKKLKKGKKYYVRIRAVYPNGVSKWSKAKKVKVK